MNTAYGRRWIRHIGNCEYAFSCEELALIRRISFLGYGVLEGQTPEKVTATDLFYLRNRDQGAANISYLLAQYLFRHAEGRKSGARLSGGHFIGRLAHHFGLVSDDGLRGLLVMSRKFLLNDMGELVKLNICMEIGDDWVWVALGPERQPDAVTPQHLTYSSGR
ncbi:hypothetical protein Tco_0015150 [Tanacetum coccineum]